MNPSQINSPFIQDLDDLHNVETALIVSAEEQNYGNIEIVQVVVRERGKDGHSVYNSPVFSSIVKNDGHCMSVVDIYGDEHKILSIQGKYNLRRKFGEVKKFLGDSEISDRLPEFLYKNDLDQMSENSGRDLSESLADMYHEYSTEIESINDYISCYDPEDFGDEDGDNEQVIAYKDIETLFFNYQVKTKILEEK